MTNTASMTAAPPATTSGRWSAAQIVVVLPSLSGYRTLFAICAGAAVLAAVLALFVPRHAGSTDAALPQE
jgi:hypothetical protein